MSVTMWKGNRLPTLDYTFTVDTGAFDLTGSTVTFSMRTVNSSRLKVNAASVSIVDALAGGVSYLWAAVDVDTVGEYDAWLTYNYLGKTQDTPEFGVVVAEHAPASIEIVYPVDASGLTHIVQGDAYQAASNRQLVYEVETMDAPLLSGSTVTMRVEGKATYPMTIVGKDQVYLELTSAQTTLLTQGTYNFAILAATSGNTVTMTRNQIQVTAALG